MANLTPALLDQCRQLREQKHGWNRISKKLGVSEYVLRCALEVGYREYKNSLHPSKRKQRAVKTYSRQERRDLALKRAALAQKRAAAQRQQHHGADHPVTALSRVPEKVLRDRDARHAAQLAPRTLTQEFFGDPPRGYSALDQRGKG